MIVNKAYRYRIYPTTAQKMMFAKTFGCVRFIYNKMLSDRIDYYKETGQKLNNTPAQYKEDFPWLKEVDSLALANAQLNLNKAYSHFWNDSQHFGKPRFKSKKNSRASYSTNNQKGSVRIEGHKVKLPKVGWVKLCQHRPLPENSIIKTVTISKTPSGKYYISMLVEYENQVLPVIPKTFLGLDFAMHGLYVASDEEDAKYPDFLRKAEKRLAKAQQKLSKKQKGSHNREKQRLRVAILHEKVANQRRDLFTNMLEYKLAWQGKQLIKIDKWYPSSQLCHVCGYRTSETKDLSVREWNCPKCGSHHDRDKNAAINIREEARRISA